MKELFHVRDASGKHHGPAFDDKIAAKRHRNELQGNQDKDDGGNALPRKFFVTAGKDHHSKQLTGKW